MKDRERKDTERKLLSPFFFCRTTVKKSIKIYNTREEQYFALMSTIKNFLYLLAFLSVTFANKTDKIANK